MTIRRNLTMKVRQFDIASGMSLIEVLIAMAVGVIALVGLLPLFMRSIVENIEGRESTLVGNLAGSRLAHFSELPFNSWELEVEAGTKRETRHFYTTGSTDSRGDEAWVAALGGGDVASWIRDTSVRQLAIHGVFDSDLDGVIDRIRGLEDTDFDGEFDNPLPAGTPPRALHLKHLRVQILGQKLWTLGGDVSAIAVDTFKAY